MSNIYFYYLNKNFYRVYRIVCILLLVIGTYYTFLLHQTSVGLGLIIGSTAVAFIPTISYLYARLLRKNFVWYNSHEITLGLADHTIRSYPYHEMNQLKLLPEGIDFFYHGEKFRYDLSAFNKEDLERVHRIFKKFKIIT